MPYKEGNGRWRGVVKVGQIRRTKFFDKKKDAHQWEVAMRRELERAREREEDACAIPSGPVTLGQWLEAYMDYAEGRFSRQTYSEKRLCFSLLIAFLGGPERLVGEIHPLHVERYMKAQTQKRSGNAANKDRKNFIAAWNWGRRNLDLPEKNPFQVEKMPEVRKPRYVPPLEDYLKVLEVAEGQDKVLLLAYFYTAARKSELLRLRWDDLDFRAGTIRLGTRKRKGGTLEYDTVPLAPSLALELKKLRLLQGVSETVFVRKSGKGFTKRNHLMKYLCGLAEVKSFGFHGIRHLSGSVAVYGDGVNLLDIQQLLRHRSLTTTQRYVHRLRKDNKAHGVLEAILKRDTQEGHVNEQRVTAEAVTL